MHNDPCSPGCLSLCPLTYSESPGWKWSCCLCQQFSLLPLETVASVFWPLIWQNLCISFAIKPPWASADWISGSKWLICLVSVMNYWTFVPKLTQLWGDNTPEFFAEFPQVSCFCTFQDWFFKNCKADLWVFFPSRDKKSCKINSTPLKNMK